MTVNSQLRPSAALQAAQRNAFGIAAGPGGCVVDRCGPFPLPGGGNPSSLFGALAGLFDALDKLVNSVGQGHGHCPGGGHSGPTTGSEFLDDYYGLPDSAPEMDPISGKGRIWGDPHFIGADGGKYDVQGRAGGIYNLLSDKGFQMNGRFDAWGGGGATVVGEVGIVANGNRITVEKDGDVKVNGRYLRDGQCVTLCDGTTVTKNGKKVEIKSNEWDVSIQAVGSRRGGYLNIDVSTDNAVSDGVKPHGLLGQTFDGDGVARNGDKGRGAQGGGAIETVLFDQSLRGDKQTVSAYEVGSMHAVGQGRFDRYGPGHVHTQMGGMSPEQLQAGYQFLTASIAFGALTMSLLESQFSQQFNRTMYR